MHWFLIIVTNFVSENGPSRYISLLFKLFSKPCLFSIIYILDSLRENGHPLEKVVVKEWLEALAAKTQNPERNISVIYPKVKPYFIIFTSINRFRPRYHNSQIALTVVSTQFISQKHFCNTQLTTSSS